MIDLSQQTEQELFDKAYTGLSGQGFQRSIGHSEYNSFQQADGTCMYRGPEGRRCAAGWLLSDEQYAELVAAKGDIINGYSWQKLVLDGLIAPAHDDFIRQLQSCHDLSKAPEEMKSRLEQFAQERGLQIPVT